MRGVAELLSPRAHDKGLEIVWSVAADAPDVVADEGRLRQILFNLAGNAVKFTDRGGVRLAVEAVGERMEGACAPGLHRRRHRPRRARRGARPHL